MAAICGEDDLGPMPSSRRTGAQGGQRLVKRSRRTDLEVDILPLQQAPDIGLIGRPVAQPLDRGGLVAKGLQELKRKFRRHKDCPSQLR